MGHIWGSYFYIPEAIFYLLKEDYRKVLTLSNVPLLEVCLLKEKFSGIYHHFKDFSA